MRSAYRKINGPAPSFAFMRLGHAWGLLAAEPPPHIARREGIFLSCALRCATRTVGGIRCARRKSPPTVANKLGSDQRELDVVGRWEPASEMPERYDRIARGDELALRYAIAIRMCN